MAHPNRKDPFRAKAKEEGYPARSVFKLKEIQEKYRLIRPGQRLVDLGCHPGSWLKFSAQAVGPEGRVLGLDLKEPTLPLSENTSFLKADLLTIPESQIREWAGEVDVVLSDLSPKSSGIKWLDHQRSLDLNDRALTLAALILKKGGALVLKLLSGEGTKGFTDKMSGQFNQVTMHKPKSSRQESTEIYLIGRGFQKRGKKAPEE
ncbi:MAG TPA: RlmE family RNA methyltransferase [Thermodesulfobacteriota bacterium]|nr:RlmE family RNA methyltransferase [Thermodesulfobacteriota bacterium]